MAENQPEIDALIKKYEDRAANPSARYVRAVDVVADLRAIVAPIAPPAPSTPEEGKR